MFKLKKTWIIVCVLALLCLSYSVTVMAQNKFNYSSFLLIERVIEGIQNYYVKNIPVDTLIRAAIKGIEDKVDPHTSYLEPRDLDDLKISSEGSFGGLGIIISIREKILTIVSPLQGTPASKVRLSAGDQIILIDGITTKGLSIDKAVDKLRGKVGSDVVVTIQREGELRPFEVTVTRGKIEIKSVPFYTMLNDSVGFIRVIQFSQNTTENFKKKLQELKKRGMQKLILDLRNNPGGLLNQAISMSSVFLNKGVKVLFSEGRKKDSNQEFFNEYHPLWDEDLIVLVNEGSASAAEIVSGALQDYDQALILGDTTFGKGSVQSVLPLSVKGDGLKVTLAYYYTPSGRCINLTRLKDGSKDTSLTDNSNQQIFYTKNKRKVYGGGGIIPDIIVPLEPLPLFYLALERRTMFFKFIIKNKKKLKDLYTVDLSFNVPDKLLLDFEVFVNQDTTFSSFKGIATLSFDSFKKEIERDSLENYSKKFQNRINALSKVLKEKDSKKFSKNRNKIKKALKREMLQIIKNDSLSTHFQLTYDIQVQKALSIFEDNQYYFKVLSPPNR